ncbi:MAG: heme ABC exporter ATP-binding protein CcmA [Anaerolineales bacterium]
MIETRSLVKTFGHKPVLRGIDLTINVGECVALFGPNGAGKTTLLRVLSTLARPTLGAVTVGGHKLPTEAAAVRRRLGVVAHQPLVYGDLTAEENLRFYARMYRVAGGAIAPLLERVGLAARRRDLARTFSRGMLQRLALARALLHAPEVLLLDEPYTGLDPAGATLLDTLLRELRAEGRTVLMTTHDLAHGFALADRSMVLSKGKIAFDARRDEMNADEFAKRYGAIVKQ